MMNVYIAQILCPTRHCIAAMAAECGSESAGQKLAQVLWSAFSSAVTRGILHYGCGMCHSTELSVELERTPWETMAEAQPHLDKLKMEAAIERLVHDVTKA